jgi:hypothetical protein
MRATAQKVIGTCDPKTETHVVESAFFYCYDGKRFIEFKSFSPTSQDWESRFKPQEFCALFKE